MFSRHKLSEFYRYQSRRYYKLFSALLHQKSGIAFRKEGKKRYDFRVFRRSIYRRRLLLLSLSSSTAFVPPLVPAVAARGRQLPFHIWASPSLSSSLFLILFHSSFSHCLCWETSSPWISTGIPVTTSVITSDKCHFPYRSRVSLPVTNVISHIDRVSLPVTNVISHIDRVSLPNIYH